MRGEVFQPFDVVRYTPRHSASEGDSELGTVTSLTSEYVFVRFDGDLHSKACRAADLKLMSRPAP